jgi:hypothetical protein
MKINELISDFAIYMSNEEQAVYETITTPTPINHFNEREKFLIQNLIKKSLLSRIDKNNGLQLVYQNG